MPKNISLSLPSRTLSLCQNAKPGFHDSVSSAITKLLKLNQEFPLDFRQIEIVCWVAQVESWGGGA